MRSSDGHHWIALDHIRAIAALLVFTWHFLHWENGLPIPFKGAPSIFPLAIFDEGHTGVSLFMVLSGYLFAKLLDGKSVDYLPFFWNRFLRLFPLLAFALALSGIVNYWQFGPAFHLPAYLKSIEDGLILPTLPNGAWSITVEAHFYLVLPFLIWATRRQPLAPLLVVILALAVRSIAYFQMGTVERLAYWTITGRVDQFVLGIFAFQYRDLLAGKHALAAAVAIGFLLYFYLFDLSGGYYGMVYSPIWIIETTIEGASYATLVAWYDRNFKPANRGFSAFVGLLGKYSYSIYLLHIFVVWRLPLFIAHRFFSLSNIYTAIAASIICFCGMIIPGWLSYEIIEKPFLRLRVKYVRASRDTAAMDAVA